MQNSCYGLAIDWLAHHVYSHLPTELWAASDYFRNLIDLNESENQCSCLVEFHHHDPEQLDFSFGMRSSAVSISSEIAPPWWNSYLGICDRLLETPRYSKNALTEENIQQDLVKAKNSDSNLIYPDYHFYEFDNNGDSFKLGGFFQQIWVVDNDFIVDEFMEKLDETLAIQGVSMQWAGCKNMLSDIFQSLGFPVWIGFMVNRHNAIKLIFRNQASPKILDHTFWKWFSPAFKKEYIHAWVALQKVDGITIRTCLDLSLQEPIDQPRLCFELFMTHPTKETRNWTTLSQISDAYSLSNDLISTIKATHSSLPFGVKKSPFSHLFKDSNVHFSTISAMLSHYKICHSSSQGLKLKTYVALLAEN